MRSSYFLRSGERRLRLACGRLIQDSLWNELTSSSIRLAVILLNLDSREGIEKAKEFAAGTMGIWRKGRRLRGDAPMVYTSKQSHGSPTPAPLCKRLHCVCVPPRSKWIRTRSFTSDSSRILHLPEASFLELSCRDATRRAIGNCGHHHRRCRCVELP